MIDGAGQLTRDTERTGDNPPGAETPERRRMMTDQEYIQMRLAEGAAWTDDLPASQPPRRLNRIIAIIGGPPRGNHIPGPRAA